MTTELFGENSKNYVQNAPLYGFRYYQSYKAVKKSDDIPHDEKMAALEWLEGAMSTSTENLPDVLEDTFVAVDTSGSMNSPVSNESDLQCVEIASLFGSLLFQRGADVASFATNTKQFHGDRRDTVTTTMERIRSMAVGGGTNGYLVPKELRQNDMTDYSQVIVFTDMQFWNSGYGQETFRDEWNRYKQANPDASLYLVDLQSYGTLSTPEGTQDVYNISGWSENVVDFIDNMENVDDMIREIEAIEADE